MIILHHITPESFYNICRGNNDKLKCTYKKMQISEKLVRAGRRLACCKAVFSASNKAFFITYG